MSQSRELSDEQVGRELEKMMAFIKQEASEKAKEIRLKADEEASKEKSRLVQEGSDAIEADYEKKYKSLSQSQQIQRSQVANKTRLRILASQQQLIDDLFDETEKQLAGVSKDKGKYKTLLKGLVLESVERFGVPTLMVQARKEDAAAAAEAAAEAAKEYKSKTGKECKITHDESTCLGPDVYGGLVITSGKIAIDNTLAARLDELRTEALPDIREKLVGKNINRKFYD
ncbi:putative vacuolar atp synthase subunit e protein [Zalerion maritima]|uniref:Vacuolar atp synthase subunit e protein n=1 Tax=Zalerion maritima TaxID=339359 RepID=A0AAD5RS45_9PEZI|nr:putative vacuolar atp synthase subunit e protein [Zalerion maritima]